VQLLTDFPQVVNQSKVLPTPSTEVEHHISTTGPPISSKFRRLDSIKLAAATMEFFQMEKEGIVQRSDSPWSSPLHMVMKSDGSWRPCGNYPILFPTWQILLRGWRAAERLSSNLHACR
jgi:hypothetical protein